MAVAQGHVPRLLQLVRLLEKRGSIGVAQAARELGIGEKELAEDVRLLSTCGVPPYSPGDLFEIEIEGDRLRLGPTLVKLPRFQLTAEELAGLRLAARLAEAEGWGESRALRRAVGKLEAALVPEERERGRRLARRLGLPGAAQPVARHLASLERAVRERREVAMTHFSEASETLTERNVRPYRVVASPEARYLVGYDVDREAVRTYRVDRIHRLRLTARRFEPPEDFEIAAHLPFAGEGREGRIEVTLRFDREVARLACDQFPQAETARDGSATVRLKAWAGTALWRLVLSWGGSCEVLAPESAREAVREYARAIEAAHGKAGASA